MRQRLEKVVKAKALAACFRRPPEPNPRSRSALGLRPNAWQSTGRTFRLHHDGGDGRTRNFAVQNLALFAWHLSSTGHTTDGVAHRLLIGFRRWETRKNIAGIAGFPTCGLGKAGGKKFHGVSWCHSHLSCNCPEFTHSLSSLSQFWALRPFKIGMA